MIMVMIFFLLLMMMRLVAVCEIEFCLLFDDKIVMFLWQEHMNCWKLDYLSVFNAVLESTISMQLVEEIMAGL